MVSIEPVLPFRSLRRGASVLAGQPDASSGSVLAGTEVYTPGMAMPLARLIRSKR
jgi:hypothetical protein